jgi:signal transduction histidine kinase
VAESAALAIDNARMFARLHTLTAHEERARIARELHDIVAHSVSVMTVQAGAIEEIAERDAQKAKQAAQAIRETGRDALTDLRRLLGFLRTDTEDAQMHAPQPGLAELEPLLDQVRQAGLEVDLQIEGTVRPLPPAVDLAAFRVVQEALTNCLKHAEASHVRVGVRYRPDELDIEVVDDGSGQRASHVSGGNGSGHGLFGMTERIGLHQGTLEYGRLATGGFRVHARLPVEAEQS